MKDQFANNLTELHGQIADACEEFERDIDEITIVGITKTNPASLIKIAVAAGIHNIGESRIQEAQEKIKEVGPIARFHLVGHLQTNKARKAVELFDVIQSVDSIKLANEINLRAYEAGRNIECYLQINISGEDQKFGIEPQNTPKLIDQVLKLENINLTGLMAIGPNTNDKSQVRAAFSGMRALYEQSRGVVGSSFDTLSMGMSSDFRLAIAEGSNMLRIGSVLFGQR